MSRAEPRHPGAYAPGTSDLLHRGVKEVRADGAPGSTALRRRRDHTDFEHGSPRRVIAYEDFIAYKARRGEGAGSCVSRKEYIVREGCDALSIQRLARRKTGDSTNIALDGAPPEDI